MVHVYVRVRSVRKLSNNMNSLQQKYNETIRPELQKELKIENAMAVPRIQKVVVNVGFGKHKEDKAFMESILDVLERITGQKPLETAARLSISNFKIREGMIVGAKVTLRGKRMYDFVQKLVRITFPRVRDFRGIPVSKIDRDGNLNIGFKEHNVFPEISTDEVERLFGLEVTIVSNATSAEQGELLFRKLGFPLQKGEQS